MRKPSFGVVTFVITVLVILGVASRSLRRLIPAISENAMGQEREPFLLAGRLQSVPWQRLTPDAFAEARRSGKPVLLFIGLITSRTARQIDEALQDQDVARLVSRRFVCIRVDGLEHPEWVNAFLPLSRLKIGFQPGAQVWILDPSGRPFFFIGRLGSDTPFHDNAMLASFEESLTKFEHLRSRRPGEIGQLQDLDLAQLAARTYDRKVDFAGYVDRLRESIDRRHGGFPVGGVRQPFAQGHRFLLSTGSLATARDALDPLLRSPLYDLVNGGFFHVALRTDPWYLEFDKWTSETAEMAHVLAMAYRLLGDVRYRDAAQSCLEALDNSLMGKRYLSAGEIGYTYGRDRSVRHSYPPRRLADALEPEERTWAQSNLALDVRVNPQAVPYLNSFDASDNIAEIRTKLQKTAPASQRAPEGYADVHLGSLARAIQGARLLGSPERRRDLSHRLDKTWTFFMTGTGQVRHRAESEDGVGLLGDYLAMADAKFQDYLATGHYVSFQDGLRVLRQAIASFRKAPGLYVAAPSSPGLPRIEIPELADNLRESTTSQMIRLLLGYGRLLGDRPEGATMLQEAYATVQRFGQIAPEGGVWTASFLSAAADASDRSYAVCTGPNAQALADELARRCPARLAAPAFGDLRRDLAARGPGVYVIRDSAEGPLSLEQAARLLPPTLELTN